MADVNELTPEELAEFEKITSPPSNVIRDLSADELFELSIKDPDNFHLSDEFSRNQDLWGDQTIVQKVADVNQRIKDRGFALEDIPGPVKMARTVGGILKGLGKQAWNYTSALVVNPALSALGDITGQGPGFTTELAQQGQRQVMENIAGTEQAVTGLARMGEKLGRTVVKSAAGFSGVEPQTTPEQRVKNLWGDVGVVQTEQEIARGRGGFLEPVGGEVRKELEVAGKPVRPEEVTELAAGDPFSFWTFGKAFQGVGKVVPARVGEVVEKAVAKAGPAVEQAAGKTLQAAGVLTELGGKTAQVFGPTAGAIVGTIKAGPFGTFAGEALGRRVQGVARKAAQAGEKMQTVGKQIADEVPVVSGTTQLAKDVAGAVPMTAAEVGKGLAFDIGTAALTSESPQDTQSVGIGAFFGGANALRRAGGRIISGQIVGPRAWGSDTYVPSSGKVDPVFEAMHTDALKTAAPAVRTRLNAVREFLKGSNADTDVFLAKDAPALASALQKAGMDAQSAKTASEQAGFFQATIPGTDGTPRRVIFARNVDAAPHEAFHAIQDVLGEDANQMIDQIVRQEYGPQWEAEGQRYARRIDPNTLDWRETVLDETGTGLDYAKEKIAMDVANEFRNATGTEPTAKYVQNVAKEVLGQATDRALQANPGIDPNQIPSRVWRDILSPQEAGAVADTYLARELAAENFDAVFKNLGASLNVQGLTGRLARVVANLASTLGIEPLSPERVSQIGKIAPKFSVTEAVRKAPSMVQPRQPVEPSSLKPVVSPAGKQPVSDEPVPPTPTAERTTELADEARTIAESAPETSPVAGTASPREILGSVAEAIAQQSGLKVNYLSAEGEGPAASISSNREARRAVIEAFRTMPPEARALWEKNFFPDRVIKLKGNKFQILGWAPEVFASNAHKLAAKLTELGVAEASPYPIAEGSFTPEGWKQLFEDTKVFVQNQMGGRTGAGEPLVVPKGLPGMFAPPEKGQPVSLDQTRADFISMLFGIKLPETARVQKGRLPLNIAGQEVSAATKPGRVEVPVIPRGVFEGAEAERQGIAGRQIMEVNPLRQQIEALAQERGVAMPEFIEAQQRLNLENIKNVEVAPELPQFRANTLTLAAGFQPQTAKGRELEQKGFVIEPFGYYGTRGVRAVKDGKVVADVSSAVLDPNDIHTAEVDMVWTREDFQKQGLAETLYRELATLLQKDGITKLTGIAIHPAPVKIREKVFGPVEVERTRIMEGKEIKDVVSRITPEMQFQPKPLPEEKGFLSEKQYPTLKEFNRLLEQGATGQEIAARIVNNIDAKDPSKLWSDLWTATKIAYDQGSISQQRFAADIQDEWSRIRWNKATQGKTNPYTGEPYGPFKPFGKTYREMVEFGMEDPATWDKKVKEIFNPIKNWVAKHVENLKDYFKPIPEPTITAKALEQVDWSHVAREYDQFAKDTGKIIGENLEGDISDLAQRLTLDPGVDPNKLPANEKDLLKDFLSIARDQLLDRGISPVQFQPKSAEDVLAMSNEDFSKWAQSMATTGGFTEAARQLGRSSKNPETLKMAYDALQEQGKQVIKDAIASGDPKQMESAAAFGSKAQFFREAYEAAPNIGSMKEGVDTGVETGDTGAMKFQPKEYELKPAKQGFSKAWILPNGKPVQLGGQWHHDFLNENDALRKQYGIPKTEGDENRVAALSKGFARINYDAKSGRLTVEAREVNWPKLKQSVRDFVDANAGKIDWIEVHLMDHPVEDVMHSANVKVFELDDNEKAAMTPFLDLGGSPQMSSVSERLFRKAGEVISEFERSSAALRKKQLQPTSEEEAVGKRMDQRLRAGAGPGRYMFEQARRYHPLTQELDKIREGDSSGQTFTKTGEVWNPGDRKADIVTLASINVPTKDLTPEKFREAIAPYKDLLSDDVVAGVFKLSGGENSSIDINAVVSQEHRDNTVKFAKDNDQQAVWDAVKNEIVETGGSGETKLKTVEQIKAALPALLKGEKFQFQPKEADEGLPGIDAGKRIPTKRELSEMTSKELSEFYPEAVISKDPVPSKITESPLFKRAIDEDAAVRIFGDKLAEFARENADNPLFKAGRNWYEEFTPQLKKEFGADAELFAELLAATSPQTGVATNFGYAVDAVESFRRGRFTKIMAKFHQGLDMMANDTWKAWYNRELKAGNIPDPPVKPTPASFMEAWINKHNLKPRQTNGALYGTHSLPVLQVFARQWLTKSRGPKTLNFVENLLGTSDEATIDLWADRTMRRIGYAGEQRWRVLPRNAAPVSDKDFAFSQKAFRHAATQLGMKPSSLQAALWFAEKNLWDRNGWSKLDLGDFREQMKRLPALREGIEERLKPKQTKLKIEPR